jgi:hypothetical protein
LLVFGGAAALCVWVTVQRDHRIRRFFAESTEAYGQVLQQHLDRYGNLPARIPESPLLEKRVSLAFYADAPTRYYVRHSTRPVIIGYSPMAELFVEHNGRSVIFFEDGKLRTEWVQEGPFRELRAVQERATTESIERARDAPLGLPNGEAGPAP